jgi:hypothetical protein
VPGHRQKGVARASCSVVDITDGRTTLKAN